MISSSNKFVMTDAIVTRPQCHFCARWTKGTLTCEAFAGEIPMEILLNKVNHFLEPVASDGGLLALPHDNCGPPTTGDLGVDSERTWRTFKWKIAPTFASTEGPTEEKR